jgi:uncharacterized OsmC-like protein
VPALLETIENVRRDPTQGMVRFNVASRWDGQTRSVGPVSHYELGGRRHARSFEISADEPYELLGTNRSPNPQELLLAALNACLTVGLVANAAAMGIHIDALEVSSEGQLDLRGFLGIDAAVGAGYDEVHYHVRLQSDAPAEKIRVLHEHVMRTSPNFANFARGIRVVPQLHVNE